ncbi:MAG: TIGR00266 family protein [Chloroflexi bacterium]|nr:TIGR00266 family protein [Chloroflexota bacterium]MCQ3929402.1 TIGR00266 family protein [Chloroflexota bacterium]NOG62679.1 TIGR00266 family protein [Chloroflexota bacterium]GIK63112.1 MAG: TIGR00266 family protein [Chloroflexota bacterium]
MRVELKHQPSYSLAVVTLAPNEQVKAESSAMVSFSDGVNIETKAEGGLLGGLKRAVSGESFFQNTFTAPPQGGEVTFAPSLPGDMRVIQMGGTGEFLLQSGAYIASELGVTTDTKWGGSKGFFGSGSLILIKVGGQGQLLIGCYGSMEERVLAPGQKYNVDTGHIVGFDASIQFQVRKVGGWKSTIFSGEGLICQLTGPGRVLMQTRSEEAFLSWLIPQIPSKSN